MLISPAALKSWAAPNMDGQRDEELARICQAAQSWLESRTRRVFEQTAFTRYFDGKDGSGFARRDIFLDPGHRPVVHSGATLVTVTEDGTALTVATGYSTSAGVILVNANVDAPCILRRNDCDWSGGIQNIAVTYTAGPASTGEAAIVGTQLMLEIAWLMFSSALWVGKTSVSKAGESVSWEKQLSPLSLEMIRSLTVLS